MSRMIRWAGQVAPKEVECMQGIGRIHLKEKQHQEELEVYGKIILHFILEKMHNVLKFAVQREDKSCPPLTCTYLREIE
jgi:hypothetical protein